MHFDTYDQALARAADLCGVEPHFWDIFGNYHAASPETRMAIVRALGMPDGSREQIAKAVEEKLRAEWQRILPPCLVVSETDRPMGVPLQIPAAGIDRSVALEVGWEDGGVHRYEIRLNELPETDSAAFGSHRFVRKQFMLPDAPPLGYHSLRVTISGMPVEEIAFIVTPERAFLPDFLKNGKKAAGVAISLYGLRSDRNWGCGDFHDLRKAIDWVAGMGAAFVALNPLHAIHNRRPYNTSPYLPNSVFYRNPIYLDIEAIADFGESARAQRLWAKPETRAEIELLRGSQFVEYERVGALKMRFLKLLFLQFRMEMRRGTERSKEFEAYCRREGDLLNRFATYCALDEHLHARDPQIWVWHDWPHAFQDPDSEETRDFQRKHWRSILFYKYAQWQIDLQLAAAQEYSGQMGLAIGLYHDLALATDRCGSDLWAHRPFYVNGCRVGSPPDEFSPKGQDWA
ncbi:MAG: 4-alpha-glucanotransferase, partial [Acidobacteriota bacterium]|nr:4-alpha-glucanotransferase [Acidobacteriota bacterium]